MLLSVVGAVCGSAQIPARPSWHGEPNADRGIQPEEHDVSCLTPGLPNRSIESASPTNFGSPCGAPTGRCGIGCRYGLSALHTRSMCAPGTDAGSGGMARS